MSVGNSRKRKTLALAVLCSLLLVLTCAVFPNALGATNDTSDGIAVITEDGAEENPAEDGDTAKAEDNQGDESNQAGNATASDSSSDGAERGDKTAEASDEEEQPVGEMQEEKAVSVPETDEESDSDAIDSRALKSLTVEKWATNDNHGSFSVPDNLSGNGENITESNGMSVENIASLTQDGMRFFGTNREGVKGYYTFWKASLKGKDGNWGGTNYGDEQTSDANKDETKTGATIERIRYYDGEFWFRFSNSGAWEKGEWTSVDTSGRNLQIVFYYKAELEIKNSSNENVLTGYTSDWFATNGKQYPRGVVLVVEDATTNQKIAESNAMYFHGAHKGVGSISAAVGSALDGYDVLGATKYAAKDQKEDFDGSYDKSDVIQDYTAAEIRNGDVNTNWQDGRGKDPQHVVIVIRVAQTGKVKLEKKIDGTLPAEYKDKAFTFRATLRIPDGADLQLKSQYQLKGDATGNTVANVTLESDYKSGVINGIQVKPGNPVYILGLPAGTEVIFDETQTPAGDDTSLFKTSFEYTNENTADAGKTKVAVARPEGQKPGSCVCTNKVSDGKGKITVRKTFTGLNALTDAEQTQLDRNFQIVPVGGDDQFQALATYGKTGVDGKTVEEPNANGSVTYEWTLNHLPENKQLTLREQGYQVSGYGVKTTTSVSQDGEVLGDTVETTVTVDTKTVEFNNQYGRSPITFNIKKEWADQKAHPDSVQVKITSFIGEGDGKAQLDDPVYATIDLAEDWKQSFENLPSYVVSEKGTEAQLITYDVEEVKVGDENLADSKYEATVDGDQNKGFVITNKLKAIGSLEVEKVDAKTHEALKGARFQLLMGDEFESAKPVNEEPIQVNDKGIVTFEDLEAGTYWIKETYVPSGYQLSNPYKFVLGASGDATLHKPVVDGRAGDVESIGAEVSAKNDVYHVKFENKGIENLPQTGGVGNGPLFAAGAMLIAGAVAYTASRKKFAQK